MPPHRNSNTHINVHQEAKSARKFEYVGKYKKPHKYIYFLSTSLKGTGLHKEN